MSTQNDPPQNNDEPGARKFRKKPVEVEAMQWDGTNAEELIAWTDGAFNPEPCGNTEDRRPSVTACLYVDANVQHLGIVTGELVSVSGTLMGPVSPSWRRRRPRRGTARGCSE